MALTAEKVVLQSFTAQAAGTIVGNWVDLSAYRSGAFYMTASVNGGTWTPSLFLSPDEGALAGSASVLAYPTGEVAALAALTGVGMSRSPVIGVLQATYVRVSSVIATGPVTGSIYFIGKV
jgi:hypothetical protein